MAVATDSHRDFLIPEHTVRQYTRQRMRKRIQMNRVYSFVRSLYHRSILLSIEFFNYQAHFWHISYIFCVLSFIKMNDIIKSIN